MNRVLTILVINLISICSFCQTSFYTQKGSIISKVENYNPDQINAIEWQVRLYKKNNAKVGNAYWGTIKGITAKDVMTKLKDQQAFELNFNSFIGKGRVQENVFTHFNPLGPIAIIDEIGEQKLSNDDKMEKMAELYGKAKDYYEAYSEIEKILKSNPPTPFDDIGNVFREYTNNIKDAFKQIDALRNLLEKKLSISMDYISKSINEINKNFKAADLNSKKIATSNNYIAAIPNKDLNKIFYVFITTEIKIKPKQTQFSDLESSKMLFVISKPMLHNGDLKDDMKSETNQFIEDLQKHFADQPNVLSQLENNQLEIHYANSDNNHISKTSTESFEAIQSYKNSIKETLEGLAQFEFLQF